MRTKIEKTLKTAAAAIFVAALGLNIIATLDGSAIYSDAIAQETGGIKEDGMSNYVDGETYWFTMPESIEIRNCPIVNVTLTEWQGVSGEIEVGTVIPIGGGATATVTVNASGEKGYWYQSTFTTTGEGTRVNCVGFSWHRTCTPGKRCPYANNPGTGTYS